MPPEDDDMLQEGPAPLRQDGDPAEPGLLSGLPPAPPDTGVDKKAVVEALLFVSPEPLSAPLVSEITGFDPGAVREIINRLAEEYSGREGGVVLREVAGGFGFYACPEAAVYISRLIRSSVNPRLTRAALETIAIVAYLQPVSRSVVAEIRGVQSEGVMRTLEERGLVRVAGRGGPPGYPALFTTTNRFLERFGLRSLDDLPALEDFAPDESTVEKIRSSLSWEMAGEEPDGERSPAAGSEGAGGGGNSLPEGG
ncbi:MAG: SMC-Scp complex subunit ScpB [Actinobacteria bacterium]|nr:SMC-Scp complex subunit ScpB [Actinomycetota bacterium]MBU1942387.1 SMC-Scp complex subunit ScpB [Actinomycetota bacterium]